MTPNDFTYWLQGFFEMTEGNNLTEKQVQIIRDHLGLIFDKQTEDYSKRTEPAPEEWVRTGKFPMPDDYPEPVKIVCSTADSKAVC